jgi:hypothetical protein
MHSVHEDAPVEDGGTVIASPSVVFTETIASESLATVALFDGSTMALHAVVEGTRARRSPVPTRPERTSVSAEPEETVPKSEFLAVIWGTPALELAVMVAAVRGNERTAEMLNKNIETDPVGTESKGHATAPYVCGTTPG